MDKSLEYEQYRKRYKEFYYNKYSITEDKNAIYLEFEFEIPKLAKFNPQLKILKKDLKWKDINSKYAQNMVFNIGLIELISYWKSTCSPQVIIKCGYLNENQKQWWKKLYYYGLGELFYINNIHDTIENFMDIECTIQNNQLEYDEIDDKSEGYIIPIGGGKDSVVTLETLNIDRQNDYCLIINPKPVTLKCAEIAGLENKNIIEIYRKIDTNLIELNQKGFINGHTPFSAMLAFVSYFVAYLLSKKYIALSNENSANESNVVGEKINHQYSKSYEFECDFEEYATKNLKAPVKYFSFLRPLNELQIAKLFSKHNKYHNTFKSCNVGSKGEHWIWCCNCAKCMFAYIILSPFLYKEKLVKIFGEDLFARKNLLDIFIDLTGNGKTKPFDCVGTYEEVNFAIQQTINNIEEQSEELPYLLKVYKEKYGNEKIKKNLLECYNVENNLTKKQNEILRKAIFDD